MKAHQMYDTNCEYIQGMNFIIGALVYHCSSNNAFWLFENLMENYGLRKNYINDF